MKLRFYLDVLPSSDPKRWPLYATTQPAEKVATAKRIAFDVTIPDTLLYSIDGFAAEVSQVQTVGTPTPPTSEGEK